MELCYEIHACENLGNLVVLRFSLALALLQYEISHLSFLSLYVSFSRVTIQCG